jgi:hypothetical protein
MKTLIHSRRSINFIHALIPLVEAMSYHEVEKLAFNLLPILLSRIKALGGPQAYRIAVFLQSQPPFYLIENDPLEVQKAKATQAIEDFLKV